MPVILCFAAGSFHLSAQMIADFETPATSPPLSANDAYGVVANPDKLSINSSDSVAYYRKESGNWHWITLHFPDTVDIRHNNTLSFKLRTSTQGRIFAKFYLGTTVVIENWCPVWDFMPEPFEWTECTMDLTPAMNKQFDRLQFAAAVDNSAESDIWIDDVRLSNPQAGDGTPVAGFSISDYLALTGDTLTFDASDSYDYDGDIVDYAWDFEDGGSGSGMILEHVYTADSVFMVRLTVTDNEGRSQSLSKYVFIATSGGKIGSPRILTATPETCGKVEAIFHVNGDYLNPYDPDEVAVDAVIRQPEGDSLVIPCFWFTDADMADGQWQLNPELQGWKLRFASGEEGVHKLFLKLHDTDGEFRAGPWEIEILQGDRPGIIRNDTVNKQYYRHSTGEPFYPLGINLGWNDMQDYTRTIKNLSRGRANIIRYWLTPFARQALEWDEDFYYAYEGLGRYEQIAAAMCDSVLELCSATGVNMQLVLLQHGLFSENVDAMWDTNPYNSANGGFVDRAEEYFYSEDCRNQTKKLFRYIVARYAWSSSLFAWEFFNEVQFTGDFLHQSPDWWPGVVGWHSDMSRYIDSVDPYNHIQTTSASTDQLRDLDSIRHLDNLQYHIYESETSLLNQQEQLDRRFRKELTGSSIINGEYGTSNEAETPFGIQRHEIWSGIMTQTPRFMWIWEHYLEQAWADLFLMPAEYLDGEDFSRREGLVDVTLAIRHPSQAPGSLGMSDGRDIFGYIYDPAGSSPVTGAGMSLPDLPRASYDLTWYEPVDDMITEVDSIVPFFDNNIIALPEFSGSIAFKLKYHADYTAPIAVAEGDTVLGTGGKALLSAEKSYSQTGGNLSYLWRLLEKPLSSEFILADSTGTTIEVSPDVPGIYHFSLIVNDGILDSKSAEVSVRLSSVPVAIAPGDTVLVTDTETYLRLSGKESFDPDGGTLIYLWQLIAAPEGSDELLAGGETSGITTLKVDAEGEFIIGLKVNNGYQLSEEDTTVVISMNTGTGISLPGSNGISVYPNPGIGNFTVNAPGLSGLTRFEVLSIAGRKIHIESLYPYSESKYFLNLRGKIEPDKLYYLNIISGSGKYCIPLMIQMESDRTR